MSRSLPLKVLLLTALVSASVVSARAQSTANTLQPSVRSTSHLNISSSAREIEPLIEPSREGWDHPTGIDWGHLAKESLLFLSIEHAFRSATEEATRAAFSHPLFDGYFSAVGNLHGWSDGDEFYVNYVGHPMQGAVSGYIWTHNDRAYRDIEFGKNRKYWKGKLRSGAFSFVYSAALEIGPLSEASIGQIQNYYPAQGFVDFVVTPAIGMGWSIAEDALDQYLVRYVENRTQTRFFRVVARGGLNPARSMANLMAFKVPWHRDNRPGIHFHGTNDRSFMESLRVRNTTAAPVTPPPGVAPFEFSIAPQFRTYFGDGHQGSCVGGGGSAAIRLASQWQLVGDVSGCKLLGLHDNLSGDSLSYMAGARWTPRPVGRWSAHVDLLLGGTKLTQEHVNSQLEQILNKIAKQEGLPTPLHSAYSRQWDINGFTIHVGGGAAVSLNHALSLRLADVGYSRSWSNNLNGINYQHALQITSGLVLRMGTW